MAEILPIRPKTLYNQSINILSGSLIVPFWRCPSKQAPVCWSHLQRIHSYLQGCSQNKPKYPSWHPRVHLLSTLSQSFMHLGGHPYPQYAPQEPGLHVKHIPFLRHVVSLQYLHILVHDLSKYPATHPSEQSPSGEQTWLKQFMLHPKLKKKACVNIFYYCYWRY